MPSPSDPTGSTGQHRESAREALRRRSIGCAILTVSDTRIASTDAGGDLIRDMLEGRRDGDDRPLFNVVTRTIVKDEPAQIRSQLVSWIAQPNIEVVITTGGTGIARRDTTIEIVQQLLTTRLDGFGELFRMLSFDEVGAAAMLSRAVAGLIVNEPRAGGDTFVFSLPGSLNAIRTGMEKLLLPELPHLIWERTK